MFFHTIQKNNMIVQCAIFSELLPTGDKKNSWIGMVFIGLSFVKLRPSATGVS